MRTSPLFRRASAAAFGAALIASPAAAYSPGYGGLSAMNARSCNPLTPRAATAELPSGDGAAGVAGRAPALKLDIVERDLGDGVQAVRNCGATYIGGRWLVTAAHCVEDGAYLRIEAIAAAADVDDPDASRQTSFEAVCHTGYDRATMRNDIALIRLPQALPTTVRPARLARRILRQPSGVAEMTGWRRTRDGGIATMARRAFLTLNGRQQSDMLLAHPQYGAYESPCLGESGTGLFQSGPAGAELIGVFSAVEASATPPGHGAAPPEVEHCDAPSTRLIFTPIADHVAWIDNVRALCDSDPAACGFTPEATPSPSAPLYAGLRQPQPQPQPQPQKQLYQQPQPEAYGFGAPSWRVSQVITPQPVQIAPQPAPIAPQPIQVAAAPAAPLYHAPRHSSLYNVPVYNVYVEAPSPSLAPAPMIAPMIPPVVPPVTAPVAYGPAPIRIPINSGAPVAPVVRQPAAPRVPTPYTYPSYGGYGGYGGHTGYGAQPGGVIYSHAPYSPAAYAAHLPY